MVSAPAPTHLPSCVSFGLPILRPPFPSTFASLPHKTFCRPHLFIQHQFTKNPSFSSNEFRSFSPISLNSVESSSFRSDSDSSTEDEAFMLEALEEARNAFKLGEVPVGAVMVRNGEIIARSHNMVEMLNDPSAHAEILCIRKSAAILSNWRLIDCALYVTLEPCIMCGGVIMQSRISKLVWGSRNVSLGCDGSWVSLFSSEKSNADHAGNECKCNGGLSIKHPFHSEIVVSRGVLSQECSHIMKQFFRKRRCENAAKKKQGSEENEEGRHLEL